MSKFNPTILKAVKICTRKIKAVSPNYLITST